MKLKERIKKKYLKKPNVNVKKKNWKAQDGMLQNLGSCSLCNSCYHIIARKKRKQVK